MWGRGRSEGIDAEEGAKEERGRSEEGMGAEVDARGRWGGGRGRTEGMGAEVGASGKRWARLKRAGLQRWVPEINEVEEGGVRSSSTVGFRKKM